MYTLCPQCLTVFRVQSAQLNAAAGEVDCTHCGHAFYAMGRLHDQVLDAQAARLAAQRQAAEAPPTAPLPAILASSVGGDSDFSGQLDSHDSAPVMALSSVEGDRDFTAQLSVHDSAPPQVIAATPPPCSDDWDSVGQPALNTVIELVADDVVEAAASDSARQLLEAELRAELDDDAEPDRVTARVWWGLAASVLLMAAFLGQYVIVNRALLANDPQWRPWLERVCQLTRCELPLRRDVARIELLERDVRDHPKVADAVLINASFVNRADFTQPYPVFEVGFSDLAGTTVAIRRFDPADYLDNRSLVGEGLVPEEIINVRLEVMDPGRRAVSFKLEFL